MAKDELFDLGDTTPLKHNPQNFIKKGKDLYLFVNGTGRLFKTELEQNSIKFTRLDRTTHFGYNIVAFPFTYNNHIYNLGGYGLWRINGQLRIYNEKANEWDIVKLNREIPFMAENSLVWYDMAGKKIYIGLYSPKNEAIKTELTEKEFIYEVMVLDLTTNDWHKLGDLNNYIKNSIPIIKPVCSSPWGLLISMGDKLTLLDYSHNKVSILNTANQDFQSFSRKMAASNCYFKDSTLYYGNNETRTLDSIPLHYSDFKPTGEVVYTIAAATVASSYLPWMIGGLLLLVSAAIFYLLKYKVSIQILKKPIITEVKPTALPSEDSSSNEINTTATTSYFDEKELQVLLLLLDNSSKQLTTSIEALNNVLGVTKKANDVQKKQRSDVMSSINKKFSFISQNEQPIIDKTRADIDKRSFEYFIANERLDEVKAVITTT
jgi:hypothetical protein